MKTQDSVDKLINKLVDMALTTWSLHHTDLDTTRLVQTQSSKTYLAPHARYQFHIPQVTFPVYSSHSLAPHSSFPVLHSLLPVTRSLSIPLAYGEQHHDVRTHFRTRVQDARARLSQPRSSFLRTGVSLTIPRSLPTSEVQKEQNRKRRKGNPRKKLSRVIPEAQRGEGARIAGKPRGLRRGVPRVYKWDSKRFEKREVGSVYNWDNVLFENRSVYIWKSELVQQLAAVEQLAGELESSAASFRKAAARMEEEAVAAAITQTNVVAANEAAGRAEAERARTKAEEAAAARQALRKAAAKIEEEAVAAAIAKANVVAANEAAGRAEAEKARINAALAAAAKHIHADALKIQAAARWAATGRRETEITAFNWTAAEPQLQVAATKWAAAEAAVAKGQIQAAAEGN